MFKSTSFVAKAVVAFFWSIIITSTVDELDYIDSAGGVIVIWAVSEFIYFCVKAVIDRFFGGK